MKKGYKEQLPAPAPAADELAELRGSWFDAKNRRGVQKLEREAQRAMARNAARIEAGETFRSRRPREKFRS